MDLLGPFTSASGRAGKAFRSFVDVSAPVLEQLKAWHKSFIGLLAESMPKGLYARARRGETQDTVSDSHRGRSAIRNG